MRYLNITHPDVNNGLGCRVTLWVSGCSHKCPGCHNQGTWDYNIGSPLKNAWKEIKEQLEKSYIKGLTVSGGDPLAQSEESLNELYLFLKKVKKTFPSKDIWLYTGYVMDEINKDENKWKILEFCDVVVDGPYVKDLRDTTLPFRGSSNQKIWFKEGNQFVTTIKVN